MTDNESSIRIIAELPYCRFEVLPKPSINNCDTFTLLVKREKGQF